MGTDPSGLFSLGNISASTAISTSLRGAKLYGINAVRKAATDAALGVAIGSAVRYFIGADPFSASAILKDAAGGIVGGATGRALQLLTRVGGPVLQFAIKYGKGPTLGLLSVTTSHVVDTARGKPFNARRYIQEAAIAAAVGFAIDLAGQGASAFGRSALGGKFTDGQSFADGIAELRMRINQLNRQLPNNYQRKLLSRRMLRKVYEKADREGELRQAQRAKFVLNAFAAIEDSGIVAVVDDIARRISIYWALDAEQ